MVPVIPPWRIFLMHVVYLLARALRQRRWRTIRTITRKISIITITMVWRVMLWSIRWPPRTRIFSNHQWAILWITRWLLQLVHLQYIRLGDDGNRLASLLNKDISWNLFFFFFFLFLFSCTAILHLHLLLLLVCSLCTPGVWITPSVFHVHCFVRVVLRFFSFYMCVCVSASIDEMEWQCDQKEDQDSAWQKRLPQFDWTTSKLSRSAVAEDRSIHDRDLFSGWILYLHVQDINYAVARFCCCCCCWCLRENQISLSRSLSQ